jgi:ketosteroid isomerase-like protein
MLLVGLTLGCQPATPSELSEADQQAIRETIKQALNIANTSADWNAYITLYYTEDAIVSRPNSTALKGKDAIMASLKDHPAFSDFNVELLEIHGAGSIAYVYGSYSERLTTPGGRPEVGKGTYLEVWKRQANGSWKVAIDMANSELPLPALDKKK